MSAWFLPAERLPPLHMQVLVEMKEGVGQVCDAAVYLGKVERDGVTDHGWRFTDITLAHRQVKRWAFIYPEPPKNALREAFDAGFSAGAGGNINDEGAWKDYDNGRP